MGIVPLVGHATVTEDIIGDKLVSSTEGVIALDNQKGLAAMLASGKHTENKLPLASKPTPATIYGLIIDDIVKFKKDNKVVIDQSTHRAKGGWQPKTIIVGPEAYGMLQKSDEFVKHNANFTVNEAYVGKVAGLDVVYSPDLDTANWIVMSPDGFLAPKGVSATEVFDKIEGRPGAILAQSEMVYGFEVLDPKQILVHVTDTK